MRTIGRGAASLIAASALAVSATVSTELPASAASGCRVTFQVYSHVEQGDRGAKAKAAQCLLRSAGYSVRADGSFSAADEAAVKRFQGARDLSRTGEVNRRTWTALLARGSKPRLSVGDRGTAVKRLQRALTATGRSVPATGYFGPKTKAAVASVQRAKGWRTSGTATSGVWRVLQAGGVGKASSTSRSLPASSSGSSKGAKALAFAKRQLGDSYRFGASGPNSWDCSGLTAGAWRAAGVSLPHNSRAQYRRGKAVSRSNLRVGDLVFFYSPISHVAIYAGNGKVVHASRPGKPVNIGEMKYMPFAGARRPG